MQRSSIPCLRSLVDLKVFNKMCKINKKPLPPPSPAHTKTLKVETGLEFRQSLTIFAKFMHTCLLQIIEKMYLYP